MRVGFTGTRRGMTSLQCASLTERLKTLGATEFHHGDCVGADSDAHIIAMTLGIRIFIHPPENSYMRAFCERAYQVFPKRPYLDRNKDIVDATEILIAVPATRAEKLRSGTWSTVRYARRIGRPVEIL